MKNLIKPFGIALMASSLFFTACKNDDTTNDVTPTPTAANFSLTTLSPSESGRNLDEINVKTYLTADTDANLVWRRSTENLPTGWTALVCTAGNCFDINTLTMPLNTTANNQEEIKVTFMTSMNLGTGTFDLLVFDPIDSAGTVQTVTFEATLQ